MANNEQDPLEEFLLTGNPNPNRVGCPAQEVLQAVASRDLNVSKEVFAHLAKCSECSVDVKAYRLRFLRRRTRNSLFLASGLLAACLAGIVVIPRGSLFHFRFASTRTTEGKRQDVPIDLWDQDIQRGPDQALKTIHVPPTSVRLIITLPRFSHPGMYRVSLCRERNDASAFIRTKTVSSSSGPREIVTVMLELAGVEKGSYWLSTRHEDDDASDYFPVNVL